MMTPRENFIRFFNGEPYEKIPHSEDFQTFQPEELCENVCRGFVSQEQPFDSKNFGGKDFFGGEWVFEELVGGAIETGAMFEDICDWRSHIVFPDLDKIDWEGIAQKNRNYLNTDKLVRATIFTGYFERLISFVGFENAAMALFDEDAEADVRALFDALSDFYIDLIRRMHKYFNVEYIQIHDDWGTQKTQMFSKATLEGMILPYLGRVVEAAHREGCIVELHSCGQITPFIPCILDLGFNTWCGQTDVIDKPALVRQYGDCFNFGVGIMPDADDTEEQIRAKVRGLKAEYSGRRVWYFISSRHRPDLIQPIVDELESSL